MASKVRYQIHKLIDLETGELVDFDWKIAMQVQEIATTAHAVKQRAEEIAEERATLRLQVTWPSEAADEFFSHAGRPAEPKNEPGEPPNSPTE